MNQSDDETGDKNRLPRWLVVVGGIPLLAAMAIEFVGVIFRNAGWPIPGTIELVEACVLLSSAVAIVIATLCSAHAKVRVLLARAHGKAGRALRFFNALGGMIFFLALVIGSVWIIADLWNGAEHSETLRIPWLPLRIYAAVAMLVTAGLYARRLWRSGDSG